MKVLNEGIHNPDCSAVSDDMLAQGSFARWPQVNGVSTIPYTFGLNENWWMQPTSIGLRIWNGAPVLLNDPENIVKKTVRSALDKWEQASRGKLKFIEQESIAYGISFYFSNYFPRGSTVAATYSLANYAGAIKQAYVLLSPDILPQLSSNSSSIVAKALNVIGHESGHAVGLEHLHMVPEIANILVNTREGIFCSVMTYSHKILTAVSACTTYCSSIYPMSPKSLDERSLDLLYGANTVALSSTEALIFHVPSMLENSVFSLCSYGLTSAIFNVVTPEKIARPLSQLSFLAGAAYNEVPALPMMVFAMHAIFQNYMDDSLKPSLKQREFYKLSGVILFNLSLALMGPPEFAVMATRLFCVLFTTAMLGVFDRAVANHAKKQDSITNDIEQVDLEANVTTYDNNRFFQKGKKVAHDVKIVALPEFKTLKN